MGSITGSASAKLEGHERREDEEGQMYIVSKLVSIFELQNLTNRSFLSSVKILSLSLSSV